MARWFWVQPGAIVAEKVFATVWRIVEGQMVLEKKQRHWLEIVKRAVGYAWVMSWLF